MTRSIWLGILAGNLLGCYAWREAGAARAQVIVVTVARGECLDEFELYGRADSLKADAQCERVGR